MSETTKIEWCDSTFNPWIGCTKVSLACDDCYAARSTPARAMGIVWGPKEDRHRTAASTWSQPKRWNSRPFFECAECSSACRWRGEGNGESCGGCGGHVVPARRRVFCASLADVFDNEVPASWRMDLFSLIADTTNLDWLILTKRIGNVMSMCSGDSLMFDMICDRVWLGATVVNQEEADRDIPKLLRTPARIHFLSIEPMLGPTSLHRFLGQGFGPAPSWVIVGGESGPKARPLHVDWVRSIVEQCRAVGVAVHVKQLGRDVFDSGMSSPGEHWPADKVRQPLARGTNDDPPFVVHLSHPKGGDVSEWPEDIRVREFPCAHCVSASPGPGSSSTATRTSRTATGRRHTAGRC